MFQSDLILSVQYGILVLEGTQDKVRTANGVGEYGANTYPSAITERRFRVSRIHNNIFQTRQAAIVGAKGTEQE